MAISVDKPTLDGQQVPLATVSLHDETATEALGALLAEWPFESLVMILGGDLGAGKTTLSRGFLRAKGVAGAVKSPTFTLVESYEFPTPDANIKPLICRGVHHFDLYRIADPEELDYIGFEEYLADEFAVIIEWPELAGDRLTDIDIEVRLRHELNARQADIYGRSEKALVWLENQLKQHKFSNL